MRLIIIRLLAFLFPLLLISWAIYLCETEFYRLLGAYLVEFPPSQLLLPSPGPARLRAVNRPPTQFLPGPDPSPESSVNRLFSVAINSSLWLEPRLTALLSQSAGTTFASRGICAGRS